MTEKLVMIGMIALYVVLMGICLWCLWCIYKAFMEIIREVLFDFEEGKYEEKTEEIMRSGETERGTVLSGSDVGNAEKEESGEWQKKKN
jgi:hypothetical protein